MAKSLNLQTFKPHNLAKEEIQNDFDITNADVLVVVAYGNLIPTWILESNIKAINIHYSLLPSYRGASPIQSSLLNNDKKTGVTFMQMSDDLDAGKVIVITHLQFPNKNIITAKDAFNSYRQFFV